MQPHPFFTLLSSAHQRTVTSTTSMNLVLSNCESQTLPSTWSFKMLGMAPSSEARGQPAGTASDGIAVGDIQLAKPKITVAHRKPSILIHPTPHLLNLPFEVRH